MRGFCKTLFITLMVLLPFTMIMALNLHQNLSQYNGSQPVQTLTLKDAIFLALRYNPEIESTQLSRIVDKFQLRVEQNAFELQYSLDGSLNTTRTKSSGSLSHSQSYNLTPKVSLKTDTGTQFTTSMDNNSDGETYNPTLSFEVSQPLLRGHNPEVVLAPLLNQYDQEKISLLQLRSTIINEVVTVINQYRTVINSAQSLKIQRESLQRADKTLDDTAKLIKAGRKPRMDLAQAKLTVIQSRLGITRDKDSLEEAKQQLLLDIGLDPHMRVHIPEAIVIPTFQIPDLANSIKIALQNDPTYQTDLLTLKIDRRDLKVAEDAQHWQLDADAKATWGGGIGGPPNNNFNSLVNGANTSQSFGLTLSIPINDLNTQSELVSAKVALQQQIIQTRFDKKTVESNVINSVRTLKADKQALSEAYAELKIQNINLENAYLQFKYGKIAMLAVTQQQDALTSSQQSLLLNQIQFLDDITNYYSTLQLTLNQWGIKIHDYENDYAKKYATDEDD